MQKHGLNIVEKKRSQISFLLYVTQNQA